MGPCGPNSRLHFTHAAAAARRARNVQQSTRAAGGARLMLHAACRLSSEPAPACGGAAGSIRVPRSAAVPCNGPAAALQAPAAPCRPSAHSRSLSCTARQGALPSPAWRSPGVAWAAGQVFGRGPVLSGAVCCARAGRAYTATTVALIQGSFYAHCAAPCTWTQARLPVWPAPRRTAVPRGDAPELGQRAC